MPTILLFYHIKEKKEGGFTYHDFNAGSSGGFGFVLNNDHWRDFETREEAEKYADERGGVDAYSW